MWTSEALRRRAAVAALVSVSLAALRCAPPEQCVRVSDCDDGLVCVSGRCAIPGAVREVAEAGAAVDATVREGGAVTRDGATDAGPDGDAAAEGGAERDAPED